MTATPRAYFEDMYAKTVDPWGFESRAYEKRKYALTLDSLPYERYLRAFEPGCSIGVLTKDLATRCEHLVAYEPIQRAANVARARVAHLDHVHVQDLSIPRDWPSGSFDLILLSEIVYYFDEAGVAALLRKIAGSLDVDGHVVAVHYRGRTNYPLTGDRVHELLGASTFLRARRTYEEELFRLDVYERRRS